MKIYTRKQIESVLDIPELLNEIEQGLILLSKHQVMTAASSFLHFEEPPGDVHIKSGAVFGDDSYVIKIASGFYQNPKLQLPSSDGVMLLFSQRTGTLKAILLDEGMLTNLRTGIAGAIAAKHLANPVQRIGIVGTGTQAREQLYCLQFVTPCKEVLVWGRNPEHRKAFANDPRLASFNIKEATDIKEIVDNCNLIVTATTSKTPLLFGEDIRPGTHITAVGADELGKQELDATVFDRADLIAVDSLSQCLAYGDLSRARDVENKNIQELGSCIEHPVTRKSDWITVADLTGVAIEDLQVAKKIVSKLEGINDL